MTPFTRAVMFLLSKEGEWATEADGTRSRWGINERRHRDVDLNALTRDGAIDLYRVRYWETARCEDLPWPLSLVLFDGIVEHDLITATRFLQHVIHARVDGVVGPETVEKARQAPVPDVLEDYLARRALYYMQLQDFPVNGHRWLKRLFALQYEALRTDPHATKEKQPWRG